MPLSSKPLYVTPTAICLFTCMHGAPAYARVNGIERHQRDLMFMAGQPAEEASLKIKAPNGAELLLKLSPEYDVHQNLVVLDLSAQRVGDSSKKNLLEPPGRWHGMQPFIFAAPCFGRHADACGYTNPRIFKLTNLNLEIRVSVADVNVSPAMSPGEYVIHKLQLEIESVPLRPSRSQALPIH